MKRLFLFMLEITFAFMMVSMLIFSVLLPFLMLSNTINCGTVGNCIIFAISVPVCCIMVLGLDILRRKYNKGEGIFKTFEWYCHC